MIIEKITERWIRFWMRWAGLDYFGRIATRLAAWLAPPYTARVYLSRMNPKGYIDPDAIINHKDLSLGENVYIGDRVVLNQVYGGGTIKICDRVKIMRDTIIASGHGQEGKISIGIGTAIQNRCQIMAYKGPIFIGEYVQIAPNCGLYSYNHQTYAGELIAKQPIYTKGGIVLEDDVWLGYGVIVLDGVHIGKGAVIGAGSVVSTDIPENAIASGVPATVKKMRK